MTHSIVNNWAERYFWDFY